jgi:hypothetical protein
MRLSSLTRPSLSLAAVLLLSSLLSAQHSTPSSPPPPPPPSPAAAPSPAPAPAPVHIETPSISSSPTPAPAMTHTVTPSTPTTSTAPPASTAPAMHAPEPDRIVPEQKIAGDAKIEGAPRIGQIDDEKDNKDAQPEDDSGEKSLEKNSPDKKEPKPADPDLRHRICIGKDCEVPPAKSTLTPTESDLKARPCLKEPCPCPVGTSWSGHGCVATPQEQQCPMGQIRNNGLCTLDECTALVGNALSTAQRTRDARARMDQACSQNSSVQECDDLKQQHEILLQQYRSVYFSTPANCRTQLPDPASL